MEVEWVRLGDHCKSGTSWTLRYSTDPRDDETTVGILTSIGGDQSQIVSILKGVPSKTRAL
jgi:hypothetical protein